MILQLILLIGFGGAIVTYFVGKIWSKLREIFAVIISLLLVGMIVYTYGKYSPEILKIGFLNFEILFSLNQLSWLFAIMISSFTALSIIFSLSYMKSKENLDFYYMMMLLVNAAMLGIVFSGDLLSFYIFWEIMSWSTFLLISYNKGEAINAGLKYIIMSLIGSMAMLIAIISLYINYHTLNIFSIFNFISGGSSQYKLIILLLFSLSFGIKNAVMPLHTWLPDAYTESPSPFTAVLSGMLTRMGIYGFLLIMYVILGTSYVLNIGKGLFKYNYILAWLGAITIVIPTFTAMLQNDAKKLLAWHGIGQGGYMILGIAYGTSLGLAGGLFHTINHAIYIVLLFMSVAAIQYRTGGIKDLNQLGGLIKKMPIAFIGGLMGISGLIGVPLTNGFVSKWLIYKTLILNGSPFLTFAALIGTWGTILSVYKFLHNIFLGQLPEKYKEIKKAPVSMQIPILILSLTILVFGILPGIPLKVINNIIVAWGFNSLNVNIWGIASDTGTLNTINIFFGLLIASAVIYIIFHIGKKSRKVLQDENYAAGAYIPVGKYHYTVEFYAPLYKMISKYLKDVTDVFYNWLAGVVEVICNIVRKIYTGDIGTYVTYILLFLAILIYIYLR